MIPNFPDFKKLTLEEKPEVEEYLKKHLPYSDYNFLSLWSYNTKEDIVISKLNGNLIIRFRDYIMDDPVYSFIGNNKVKDTIEKLLELSLKETKKDHLKLLPEINFTDDLSAHFEIIEDRDNFDYIFSVSDLAELSGSKYHSQKNFINRFNRLYPDYKVLEIDIADAKIRQEIFDLFDKWGKARGKATGETVHERKALERTIDFAKSFKLVSVGIFHKNKLIGFMIGDIDHPIYCETHFAKGDPDYVGIFHMLYHHFAKHLAKLGYEFINNEQDLGIPGLRFSKEQWIPIKFFKKYIAKRRERI